MLVRCNGLRLCQKLYSSWAEADRWRCDDVRYGKEYDLDELEADSLFYKLALLLRGSVENAYVFLGRYLQVHGSIKELIQQRKDAVSLEKHL